jgi:hypothetical protein
MSDMCKKMVSAAGQWGTFHPHQCTKKIWKDGWCKVHHPDSIKERNEQAMIRWNEKWETSPQAKYAKLQKACIEALEQMKLGNHATAYTMIEEAMK